MEVHARYALPLVLLVVICFESIKRFILKHISYSLIGKLSASLGIQQIKQRSFIVKHDKGMKVGAFGLKFQHFNINGRYPLFGSTSNSNRNFSVRQNMPCTAKEVAKITIIRNITGHCSDILDQVSSAINWLLFWQSFERLKTPLNTSINLLLLAQHGKDTERTLHN